MNLIPDFIKDKGKGFREIQPFLNEEIIELKKQDENIVKPFHCYDCMSLIFKEIDKIMGVWEE